MPIIIYDIAIAAIVAFCVYNGYKKGFFLTLCGFLAMFVALFGAIYITNAFAPTLGEFFTPIIQMPIQSAVDAHLAMAVSADTADILAALQETPLLGGFVESMELSLQSSADALILTIAEFIGLQVARIVLFLASYILIILAWSVISRALNLAFYLPLLSSMNALAGAGVGVFQGLLGAYALAWALSMGVLTTAEIETTYLLHFFLAYNPIPMITSILSLDFTA